MLLAKYWMKIMKQKVLAKKQLECHSSAFRSQPIPGFETGVNKKLLIFAFKIHRITSPSAS